MSTGLDDIQDLLADILGEEAPAKGPPKTPGALTPGVKQAITDVAVETFDPELLEIAGALDEPLSSKQRGKAKKAATAIREQAAVAMGKAITTADGGFLGEKGIPQSAFDDYAESIGNADKLEDAVRKPPKKVTQGVTKKPASNKAPKKGGKADEDMGLDEDTPAQSAIPMPQFTSGELAKTMDIRNFASLVKLETARWHGKAKDRGAATDIAKANNADEAAFNVRKNLLAGADEALRKIHKALDAARAKHYEMTLPWTTKTIDDTGRRTGSRLLPNTLFFEYTTEMAKYLQEMKTALDEFVPEYPNLIQAAKAKLGTRFNPADYPNASEIRRHFGLSFDFDPIPAGNDFKGLPDQQLDALARTINRKTQQMMEGAMQDVWTRLYTAVSHMADRLASPDRAFHYTMVDNVREVTRLLKHLNVTSDPNVEKIRKMLDKFVTPHDAKDLRDNQDLRVKVHGYAQSIVDAMNKMGGAKKK